MQANIGDGFFMTRISAKKILNTGASSPLFVYNKTHVFQSEHGLCSKVKSA